MTAREYLKELSDKDLIMLTRIAILDTKDFQKKYKGLFVLSRTRYNELEYCYNSRPGRYSETDLIYLELADRLEARTLPVERDGFLQVAGDKPKDWESVTVSESKEPMIINMNQGDKK